MPLPEKCVDGSKTSAIARPASGSRLRVPRSGVCLGPRSLGALDHFVRAITRKHVDGSETSAFPTCFRSRSCVPRSRVRLGPRSSGPFGLVSFVPLPEKLSTDRKRLRSATCFRVALARPAIARLSRAALLGFPLNDSRSCHYPERGDGSKRLRSRPASRAALVRSAIARLSRAALLGSCLDYFVRAITRGVWRRVENVCVLRPASEAALVRSAIARLSRAALLGFLLDHFVRAITRGVWRRVENVCVLRPASGPRSCVPRSRVCLGPRSLGFFWTISFVPLPEKCVDGSETSAFFDLLPGRALAFRDRASVSGRAPFSSLAGSPPAPSHPGRPRPPRASGRAPRSRHRPSAGRCRSRSARPRSSRRGSAARPALRSAAGA